MAREGVVGADGGDHDDAAAGALFDHLGGRELGAKICTEDLWKAGLGVEFRGGERKGKGAGRTHIDILDSSCFGPAVLEEGLVEDDAGCCDADGESVSVAVEYDRHGQDSALENCALTIHQCFLEQTLIGQRHLSSSFPA